MALLCCLMLLYILCFFFFKQKTAYDMRISDWSSDVCSSDLVLCHELQVLNASVTPPFQLDDDNLSETTRLTHRVLDLRRPQMQNNLRQIGRASCRERVCQYV